MKKLNIFNQLHIKTRRNYISRMMDNKVACMIEAKKCEKN